MEEHHNTKHGKTKTRVWYAWFNMRKRCRDKTLEGYGGRGISVCARWSDFENFLEDMGEPPPGHTLDRKDNDGDYTPDNCRWATRSTQQQNQRRTVRITHKGQTLTIPEWASATGIPKATITSRYYRGKTPAQTLRA